VAPDSVALHPVSQPFDSREIAVDGRHRLYLEQFGNPRGVPAVFLHGGPGSGCQREQAQLFDPAVFRAVLFDQRGAGRSTPKGALIDNTTWHLVADLELIRATLGVERWLVVGGSWGSTLALAYAQRFPARMLGLVLRAVFLGTRREFEWAFGGAAQTFHPQLWSRFVALLPSAERADPIAAYGRRLVDSDPRAHVPAARAWHNFERALSVLDPGTAALPDSLYDQAAAADDPRPNTPYLEWHYLSHDCFLEPDQLLRDAGRLAGIPGIIVQGRYDLLCPPATATALAERWREASLRIVADAGHAASEPGIRDGLIAAIAEFGRKLGRPLS